MREGKIKFFRESKGFGFVIDDDTKKEHFVHISGLIDAVKSNERVSFELEKGKRGLMAVKVRLI
ncbi:MAG: cold shock domain-containing protein [Crocinitomicaceae bacterium]|nr:cold shock domain-containing protein [Crocinitomicaceae bacterium]